MSSRSNRSSLHPNNQFIVDKFMILERQQQMIGRQNIGFTYAKIIKSLQKYPLPILSRQQALSLEHVGEKMANIIYGLIKTEYKDYLKNPNKEYEEALDTEEDQMDSKKSSKNNSNSLFQKPGNSFNSKLIQKGCNDRNPREGFQDEEAYDFRDIKKKIAGTSNKRKITREEEEELGESKKDSRFIVQEEEFTKKRRQGEGQTYQNDFEIHSQKQEKDEGSQRNELNQIVSPSQVDEDNNRYFTRLSQLGMKHFAILGESQQPDCESVSKIDQEQSDFKESIRSKQEKQISEKEDIINFQNSLLTSLQSLPSSRSKFQRQSRQHHFTKINLIDDEEEEDQKEIPISYNCNKPKEQEKTSYKESTFQRNRSEKNADSNFDNKQSNFSLNKPKSSSPISNRYQRSRSPVAYNQNGRGTYSSNHFNGGDSQSRMNSSAKYGIFLKPYSLNWTVLILLHSLKQDNKKCVVTPFELAEKAKSIARELDRKVFIKNVHQMEQLIERGFIKEADQVGKKVYSLTEEGAEAAEDLYYKFMVKATTATTIPESITIPKDIFDVESSDEKEQIENNKEQSQKNIQQNKEYNDITFNKMSEKQFGQQSLPQSDPNNKPWSLFSIYAMKTAELDKKAAENRSSFAQRVLKSQTNQNDQEINQKEEDEKQVKEKSKEESPSLEIIEPSSFQKIKGKASHLEDTVKIGQSREKDDFVDECIILNDTQEEEDKKNDKYIIQIEDEEEEDNIDCVDVEEYNAEYIHNKLQLIKMAYLESQKNKQMQSSQILSPSQNSSVTLVHEEEDIDDFSFDTKPFDEKNKSFDSHSLSSSFRSSHSEKKKIHISQGGQIEKQKIKEYQICLLIDTRERTDRNERLELFQQKLAKLNVQCRIENIFLGDFIWEIRITGICSITVKYFHLYSLFEDTSGMSESYVLDYVVERKTGNDLGASIQDHRYKDQKYRYKRSGLRHCYYLVEGQIKNLKHISVTPQCIESAILSTQLGKEFKVQRTKSFQETILWLSLMHKNILQHFNSYFESLRNEDILNFPYTLKEYQKKNQKNSGITLKEQFGHMIHSLLGSGNHFVNIITQLFQTPINLYSKLSKQRDLQERIELIQDQPKLQKCKLKNLGIESKSISKSLATTIAVLFSEFKYPKNKLEE